MKVIFMGTPQFAVVSLKKLLVEKFNIVAVVTAPDKEKGRGLKIQSSPVKLEALRHNIPVLQPSKLKDEKFCHQLRDYAVDLIVVVAFRILPEAVFELPEKGTINLHGSLLPKYRGAAPINWAIINGEKETGLTTFFIKKQVDTGNIIDRKKIPIDDNMTAGELHDIMATVGAELLVDTCRSIETGSVKTKIQDDNQVTLAPKIFRKDCIINFNQPAKKVHDFIRGLSPYPSAHTYLDIKMIKFYLSKVFDVNDYSCFPPGSIVQINKNELILKCNPGSISIGEVQLEGKKRMTVSDFLRGYPIAQGIKFGNLN
ncbi:methionyl-tRNA formyltransferase [Calditrichota bacterium]